MPERMLHAGFSRKPTELENGQHYLAQNLRISQNDDSILGPRERDIQTTRVVQESDPLMLIAPHAAENNVILLSSLEGIHACDLNLLVQVLLERPIELHVVDDIRALALIGRHDADLCRHDTRLEELGHDLLHVGRLRAVEERRPAARDLLLAEVLVEEHGRVRHGPGEVDVLAQPLGGGDTVLKRALVEHVGREFGKTWMHAVLNLKSNGAVAQNDESLEERLCETGARRLLVHDDRAELLYKQI
ncbi:hypothetical protein B0H12DRAFT_215232 [Mycena haematopus]|nr:hypothetical protein B0H12DRAFT_215232 [Mycena haematopus]